MIILAWAQVLDNLVSGPSEVGIPEALSTNTDRLRGVAVARWRKQDCKRIVLMRLWCLLPQTYLLVFFLKPVLPAPSMHA